MTNDDAYHVGGTEGAEGITSRMGSSGGGICVACGSTMGLRGPEGGCLTCLAQFALLPQDDEANDTEDAASTRNFGHFEIVADSDGTLVKLGCGAMGITYRARDTILRTEVALKVIGVKVAGHPAARAAFLREARAAASLRHTNAASVFHYGEQDGECFYVMELVEGETLDARVRREGRLPPALVLEVGRQVACALMEAEEFGIVHRDLKPSNIMFAARRGDGTKDLPHIKVIDFGLAQATELVDAEDGARTVAGGFVGTPSFASPEQFARDGIQPVNTRSDIYSLGVTLWYLLCAELPFTGSTLTGLHEQQVRQPLRLKQLRAAHVPAPVVALLQGMLKVDPRERTSSARVLTEAIVKCQQKVSRGRHRTFLRVVLSLALIAGLMAASADGFGFLKNIAKRPVQAAGSIRLAALPFANLNPREQAAYFPGGVQASISSGLSRVAAMKVVSPGEMQSDSADARDYAKIGRELNVDYLLEGSVQRTGERVSIQVRLIDVHAPGSPWREQYEQPLSKVFDAEAAVVRGVAGRLHVALTPEEEIAIDKPPTTSLEAYDLYLQSRNGPGLLKGPEEMREQLRHDIALLERAIALDPNFVLAYCELAGDHDNFAQAGFNSNPEERAVDHHTLAEVALQKARRLDPDGGEVHLAYAEHFRTANRDNQQALVEAELAERKLPNKWEIHAMLGVIARGQGRWEDSVRELRKVAELQPREPSSFSFLTENYRARRRYAEADDASARLIALVPVEVAVEERLYQTMGPFEQRADLEPLRVALAAVEPATDPGAVNRNLFALMAALFSRDSVAMSHQLENATQMSFGLRGYDYPKAWFAALAARLRDDDEGACAAFTAARLEVAATVHANPGDARALSELAMIDAGLGRKEDATNEAKRACELAPPSKSALAAQEMACNLAVVYAWTDQPDLAFALLSELVGQPAGRNLWWRPTYGDMKLSLMWDPLRSDPRFAALVARLAPKTPR